MSQPPKMSRRREILLVALSLILMTLVAETGIRTFDAIRGYGFFSDVRNPLARDIKPVRPFKTFGFDLYNTVEGVAYVSSRHGELYPLDKPGGTYRIVVFGGSTTVNGHAFGEAGIHYPLVMQTRLREALPQKSIEVINVGYAAYCTAHSLVQLELDVMSWHPDLVILSHNVNDLTAAYWPGLTFDYSNKYSDEVFSVPDLRDIYTRPNVIFEHSQLYWFIKNRIEILKGNSGTEIRRESLGNAPPPLAVEIFKRNLQTFINVARAAGAKVVLGSQPLEPSEEYFLRHMAVKAYNSRITYPLHEEFVQHHRAFNQAMSDVAAEQGVLFLDNDASFAGDRQLFYDYVHYSPEGVRKLADNFATFLLDAGLHGLTRER